MQMSLSCILIRSDGVNAQKDDDKLQEIVQLVNIGDMTNYAIYENGSFGTGA